MTVRNIPALCSRETTPIFDKLLKEHPEGQKLFDDSLIEEINSAGIWEIADLIGGETDNVY